MDMRSWVHVHLVFSKSVYGPFQSYQGTEPAKAAQMEVARINDRLVQPLSGQYLLMQAHEDNGASALDTLAAVLLERLCSRATQVQLDSGAIAQKHTAIVSASMCLAAQELPAPLFKPCIYFGMQSCLA